MTSATHELVVYQTGLGWRYRYGARDDGHYATEADALHAGRCWMLAERAR